ncbi:copia protein [Tanacetum coccineum]
MQSSPSPQLTSIVSISYYDDKYKSKNDAIAWSNDACSYRSACFRLLAALLPAKDELTIAYLEGAGLEKLKQKYKNDVELEYHVDQLKAAVLSEAKWNNDEDDVSKPRSFERHMSKNTKPCPSFYNNNFYYLVSLSTEEKYTTSLTKHYAARYCIQGIEDMISDRWCKETHCYHFEALNGIHHWEDSRIDFFKVEMSNRSEGKVYSDLRIKTIVHIMVKKKWGYGFLTSIIVRRSDDKEYEFNYADLPRLGLNDVEDMYLLQFQDKLHHLPLEFVNNALLLFIRRVVIQNRVEDIQLVVEIFQQTLNLTKPIMFFEEIDQKIPFTMSETYKGVVYLNQHNIKSFMKFSEVKKFCDGTLMKIRDNLIDMVNTNKLGKGLEKGLTALFRLLEQDPTSKSLILILLSLLSRKEATKPKGRSLLAFPVRDASSRSVISLKAHGIKALIPSALVLEGPRSKGLMAEIRDAVWECGENKSPGLTDTQLEFNRHYGVLIGPDFCFWVLVIFYTHKLIGSVYKVITKILANAWPRKKKQALIFKVDFAKAYDSVRWDYLLDVLQAFRFGPNWCKWIRGIFSSAMASILVNGSPTSEFPAVTKESLKGFSFKGRSFISHLCYADDFVLYRGYWIDDNLCASLIGCAVMQTPFKYLGVTVGENMSRHTAWTFSFSEPIMGSYRTKEDDVAKISTSVFITNFPESFSAKELFHSCKQYGHVVDSFIPTKRSKSGVPAGGLDDGVCCLGYDGICYSGSYKLFCDNVAVGSWFSQIKQAFMDFVTEGKIAWVEIEGILFKLWSGNTFKRIAANMGVLLDVDVKRRCVSIRTAYALNTEVSYSGDSDVEEVSDTLFEKDGQSLLAHSTEGMMRSSMHMEEGGRIDNVENLNDCNMEEANVIFSGGSILSLLDELVKVGQVMGYNMDVYKSNMAEVFYYKERRKGNWVGILCVVGPKIFCKSKLTLFRLLRYGSRCVASNIWLVLLMIAVYALHDFKDKQLLWDYLTREIGKWKGEVVIMGDFNEVRYKSDRFGSVFNVQGANMFNSFITNAGLVEVSLGGSSFTWCHKSANKEVVNKRAEIVNNLQSIDKLHSLETAQKVKVKWSVEGDENSNRQILDAVIFNEVLSGCKKASWVNWKKVLAPKERGGLGVSSLYALNRGLMFKWVWRFYTQDSSLWARVIKTIHGDDGKMGAIARAGSKSCWMNIDWVNITSFWEEDMWSECGMLKNGYPRIYALESSKSITVGMKVAQPSLAFSFRRAPRSGGGTRTIREFDCLVKRMPQQMWCRSVSGGRGTTF